MTTESPGLYELRIYLAKPDKLEELIERWGTHYKEIFEDHCNVIGYYVSHPEREPEPNGVAMLLAHKDRADVDRSFMAFKTDPRIETAPGPQGYSLVEDWQRIFLYPLEEMWADEKGREGDDTAGNPDLVE